MAATLYLKYRGFERVPGYQVSDNRWASVGVWGSGPLYSTVRMRRSHMAPLIIVSASGLMSMGPNLE